MLGIHPEYKRLFQVRWNNYDRAAKKDWALRQQDEWYEAARHYNEIIERPEMQLWDQLKPGSALSMYQTLLLSFMHDKFDS